MITKDESIVNQVAAKIAAELTDKNIPTPDIIDMWSKLYESVYAKMSEVHGFGQGGSGDNGVERLQQAFPNSTVQYDTGADYAPATAGGVRVKGTQHGPLPEWLFGACADAGVTEVYDNRDGLAENNKRPWFKATTGGRDAVAFWPPKR